MEKDLEEAGRSPSRAWLKRIGLVVAVVGAIVVARQLQLSAKRDGERRARRERVRVELQSRFAFDQALTAMLCGRADAHVKEVIVERFDDDTAHPGRGTATLRGVPFPKTTPEAPCVQRVAFQWKEVTKYHEHLGGMGYSIEEKIELSGVEPIAP